MDIKSIKQIVELMSEAELSEFELEDSGLKLRITRNKAGEPTVIHQAAPAAVAAPAPVAPAAPEAPAPAPAETGLVPIPSPMVGTFYQCPSPDAPIFVKVGDKVSKDTVVCIIEAMKVMNEIQAEVDGEIVEIVAQNEQTVEFGQPLFKVRPL